MPTTVTAHPGAIAYAINRLKINLELMPEKRDPELLLAQLFADVGLVLEPTTTEGTTP